MEGFLALGFVVGLSHALEADHLAAVGALSAQGGPHRRMMLRGAAWGFGHTVTLFAISLAVILFGFALTDERSAALEFGVGAMLVVLGADVARRMVLRRVEVTVHDHGEGAHIHAHAKDAHHHEGRFVGRAVAVGLVHGAAGSAALLALALSATQEPVTALAYVIVFGVGSMAGMAALTFVAAWPLNALQRARRWLPRVVGGVAAAAAIAVGAAIMVDTGALAMRAF